MTRRGLHEVIYEGPDIFKYALILSLAVHLVMLVTFSLPRLARQKNTFKNIEVTYFRPLLQVKKLNAAANKEDGKNEDSIKKTEVLIDKKQGGNAMIKDMSKLDDTFASLNKQPAVFDELQVKRKISVPPLKSEKIENPFYQSYYQIIRSLIKQRAYANYAQTDTGEVYLTFVLLSDGTLKQLQIMEERSAANQPLKDISLKSINEASPFPPFPKDLTYPELSFNVVISFELEE